MEHRDVERAVAQAGLDLPPDLQYEIVDEDPILPSPHHLAEGGAVARLMTGVAANELWRLRTGRTQALTVDARHAAAALRSYTRLDVEDPQGKVAPRFNPTALQITDIFPTGDDRHVQLHGSFNDAPQILEELGLDGSASREDIAAAVKRRGAFELEDAFIRRRVCGGAVRTREEWAAHPQGRAIADWPVVRITKIGDAPPEPLPDGDRPTSGLRVVDLTRVLAGPTAAKTLAEHGADVLHVSAPGLERGGPFEVDTGIGKRQTWVDLREPGQLDVLLELIRTGDVFSQGYRLGSLARRGLAPEQLAELRPGIVCVSENCYGHVGPWAERPGWEQLGQAATGMSHREGQASEDGTPRLAPAAVNDYSTGFFAAYGAMVALARRAVEGGSWHVQVSLSSTCSWYQSLGDDLDPAAAAGTGDESAFVGEMATPDYGRVRYLKPALAMSETEPRWDLPTVEHGTHEPVWLPR